MMEETRDTPPGAPGCEPTWTTGAKDGVGTVNPQGRLWFTISHGIVNEVYYPSSDNANVRDLQFLVTSGEAFFSEERRDTYHEVFPLGPDASGVPGYRLVNTCRNGRYRITKIVFADPRQGVLLQKITFEALRGERDDYRLYVLLAPHAGNQGADNFGLVGDYKGVPLLFAYRKGSFWMALGCSAAWKARTVGYAGNASDGWQDLHANKNLTAQYAEAGPGNLSLTGEIDLTAIASDGSFTLTLGFGISQAEAGLEARAGLVVPFEARQNKYVEAWQALQQRCLPLSGPRSGAFDLYRASIATLVASEDKRFPGAFVASLSLPWGQVRADEDETGYHVIWPRDLVEAAGGKLAAGLADNAQATLLHLICTQEADGHWPQNMWLDGVAFWDKIQTDETAFPLLLVDLLRRKSEQNLSETGDFWPAMRRAAAFLVRNGPATQQERWESNAGFALFSLAASIAALLIAAELADEGGETTVAEYLRETADCWNAHIESWTYVTGTALARQHDVPGYYVWIAPPNVAETGTCAMDAIPLANRPLPDVDKLAAADFVGVDALALVRFGLRAPHDPRILNTLRVIDVTLRFETKTGTGWRRYTHDGYGEKPDGSPYTGENGVGRCWPLLAGERAHYELAAGNKAEAERLLAGIAQQTSAGGLLPEQIWDAGDVPERDLFNGRPTGSAMPLVWAHAEVVKLIRSLHDGQVFDTPPQTLARYGGERPVSSPFTLWRFNLRTATLPQGKRLRIELLAPATVCWQTARTEIESAVVTRDTELGVHVADLPTENLAEGEEITFFFAWQDTAPAEVQNENDTTEARFLVHVSAAATATVHP